MPSLLQTNVLTGLGWYGVLLALLVAGHALGDFVFQTKTMVVRKQETRWLASHVLEVTLCHAVFLLPFLSWSTMLAAAAIGLAHGAIDWVKARAPDDDEARALVYFALDQLAHLAVLVAAWFLLARLRPPMLPALEGYAEVVGAAAMVLAVYAFNCNGGAAVVALVLRKLGDDDESSLRMGWTIGILERMLLLTLVLLGQWIALGLIVAAKLFRSERGDSFLAGTLCSVLVAVVSGLVLRILV